MGIRIGPAGQPTDYREALGGQFEPEPLGHSTAGVAGGARSDNRDALRVVGCERAPDEDIRRRVGDMAQVNRVVRISPFYQARVQLGQFAKLPFERVEVVEVQDIAYRRPGDSGLRQSGLVAPKHRLGRTEMLKEQPGGARPDAARATQGEPISIRRRRHFASISPRTNRIGRISTRYVV